MYNGSCTRWNDREVLKDIAENCDSPTDVREAVILARRWTRLALRDKPHVHTNYRGICNQSGLGFFAWLTRSLETRMYYGFKADFPDEAAEFRRQILVICFERANLYNHTGGAGACIAKALATCMEKLPILILGEDAAFW